MISDNIPWPDDKDKPYDFMDDTPDYRANFTKLYGWRDKYYGEYNNGLDPDDYETENTFLYAIKHLPTPFTSKIYDNTEFIYCGVVFEDRERIYLYRVENISIKIGDKVIVPVGENNEEKEAMVVSVDTYIYPNVPYPVHKTKKIIEKQK